MNRRLSGDQTEVELAGGKVEFGDELPQVAWTPTWNDETRAKGAVVHAQTAIAKPCWRRAMNATLQGGAAPFAMVGHLGPPVQ